MTTVEKLRERLIEFVGQWMGTVEGEWGIDLTHERVELVEVLDSLIAAAKKEEYERIFGKTQEVHFSDGVNGWSGLLTTELPAFPKTEEGKFYLNTDHIKIIPTKEIKAG